MSGVRLEVAADGGVRDTVNSIADTHDQIVLALIAVVAAAVAGLVFIIRSTKWAREGAEQATKANAAVNNVGPGAHTLYNLVDSIKRDVDELRQDQRDFDEHGWARLPPDLGDAVALTATIRSMQATQLHCAEQIARVLEELRAHVEWEMEMKYHQHGDDAG